MPEFLHNFSAGLGAQDVRYVFAPAGRYRSDLGLEDVLVLPRNDRIEDGPYEDGEWDVIRPWIDLGSGPAPRLVTHPRERQGLALAPDVLSPNPLLVHLKIDSPQDGRLALYKISPNIVLGDGPIPFIDLLAISKPTKKHRQFMFAKRCRIIEFTLNTTLLELIIETTKDPS